MLRKLKLILWQFNLLCSWEGQSVFFLFSCLALETVLFWESKVSVAGKENYVL